MGLINTVVNTILKPIENLPGKITPISKYLIEMTTYQRPGLSESKTAARVIESLKSAGFNVDKNPDGSDNLLVFYTYEVIKEVFKEIRLNGVVEGTISPGEITTYGTGGNSGGPVVVRGRNTNVSKIKGILR